MSDEMEQRINAAIEAGWCFPHNCHGSQCDGPHNDAD